MEDEAQAVPEEKQCRICLDGEDPDLGRLIRPCLCKGSISVSRNNTWNEGLSRGLTQERTSK